MKKYLKTLWLVIKEIGIAAIRLVGFTCALIIMIIAIPIAGVILIELNRDK
jgi:hypothetical protein